MMAENIWDFYHLFNPDEVLLNDDLKKYNVETQVSHPKIKTHIVWLHDSEFSPICWS